MLPVCDSHPDFMGLKTMTLKKGWWGTQWNVSNWNLLSVLFTVKAFWEINY